MKKLLDNKVVQIGITAFLVIAAGILFSFIIYNIGSIFKFIGNILTIMMPLIYGLVLAYIMHPIVNLFEKKVFNKIEKEKTRRNLSILCTFVVIIGLLVALISIIIPQLLTSIQSLLVNVPDYLKDLESAITNWLSNNKELSADILEKYDEISKSLMNAINTVISPFTESALDKVRSGVFGFLTFIFNFAIGAVFAVYILANTKNFGAGIRKTLYSFFDIKHVDAFIDEVKHVNHVFCQFMIGKICDSFGFVFTCTLLFLLICKYPYALLIAVLVGTTDLIPYFGPYIGTIPSALLICMISPVKAITFVLFIVVLQQIDGNFVTPAIQKQATGLPSFWVLFAITLFGGLFGLVGLLIAVPCFTIIYELIVDLVNQRLKTKKLPTNTDAYTLDKIVKPKTLKKDNS